MPAFRPLRVAALAAVVACAAASPALAVLRTTSLDVVTTIGLRLDIPNVSSTPFSVTFGSDRWDHSLELRSSHEDVYVWKVNEPKKKKKSADNPLYQGNNSAGENPFYESPSISTEVVFEAAPADPDNFAFYSRTGNSMGHSDKFKPQGINLSIVSPTGGEVIFDLPPALELLFQGKTPLGSASNPLFDLGTTTRYDYQSEAVLLNRRGPSTSSVGYSLYLESLSITTTVVPEPAAAAILAPAALLLGRSRRRI